MNQMPVYARADRVAELTGVSRYQLVELAKNGLIRSVKLAVGEGALNRQSPVVYRVADVIEWIESLPAKDVR